MKKPIDRWLTKAEQDEVVEAIRQAERRTSGEIKVHLEKACRGEPLERAKRLFGKLGLTRTAQRNAVLLYVAIDSRKFAILGDIGIHQAVGQPFWQEAAHAMESAFRAGHIADGLKAAIGKIGDQLERHFPHRADDRNELDDGISAGDVQGEKE